MDLFIAGFLCVIFQSHLLKLLTSARAAIKCGQANELRPMYSGMTKPSGTNHILRTQTTISRSHTSICLFIHCNEALRITIYKLYEANVNRSIPFIGIYYLGRQIATNVAAVLQSE